jgi:hypothetical protein
VGSGVERGGHTPVAKEAVKMLNWYFKGMKRDIVDYTVGRLE